MNYLNKLLFDLTSIIIASWMIKCVISIQMSSKIKLSKISELKIYE